MDRAWGMCNPTEDMEGLNGMLCMRVGECVGELNKFDYGKLVTFSQKWRNWKRCKDVRTPGPPHLAWPPWHAVHHHLSFYLDTYIGLCILIAKIQSSDLPIS